MESHHCIYQDVFFKSIDDWTVLECFEKGFECFYKTVSSSEFLWKAVDPSLETIPKLSSKQITDRILKESLRAVIEESEEDLEELSSIEKSIE